jgi:hypothetical protein
MKSGMVKAFAVMGCTGEWGDTSEWLVAIHADEESANAHAVQAKDAAMEFMRNLGGGGYYVYGATDLDPDFKSDGGFIAYRVVPTVCVVGGMGAWVQGGRTVVHQDVGQGGARAPVASGQFACNRVGSIDAADGTFADKLSRAMEVDG